jgi:cation transport ATPase
MRPPSLSGEEYAAPWTRERLLPLVAALERSSRHPLAGAIVRAAETANYPVPEVEWLREDPGAGLVGRVAGMDIRVTNRARATKQFALPPGEPTGLECVIIAGDQCAATLRFHDVPRPDSRGFVLHLGPRHGYTRVLLVSGDRESEVKRLAASVASPTSAPRRRRKRRWRSSSGKQRGRRRSLSATASTTRPRC